MAESTVCGLCGRTLAPHGGGGGSRRHAYCGRCTASAVDGKAAAGAQPDECKECGKKFYARTRSVKYCSDACSAAGTRRSRTASQRKYMTDPENRAMSLARSRALYAARTAKARGQGRPRRRSAGRRSAAARRPRSAKMAEPSTCRLCGRTFAQYGHRRTNYCKRCRARIDRKINTVLAVGCKVCGKRFSTKSPLAKYCSRACGKAARNSRCRVAPT